MASVPDSGTGTGTRTFKLTPPYSPKGPEMTGARRILT